MAVVVEPVLTEEKLRSLLAEQHEHSCLDYKRVLNLATRCDVVELAKDVAAMQSEATGGYLVIGADDHGMPVADLTPELARHFDEATLRKKLARYLAEPFTVRSAQHKVNGNTVAIVYIGASDHVWCIFKADGDYEDPAGKRITVFRVGDVFVRHGTSSERWNDADRERLTGQIVARHKEAWRRELRGELDAMTQRDMGARRLEELPSAAVTWKLDAQGFDQQVTELMRRNDDIPLRQLLLRVPADATQLVSDGDADEMRALLDRLSSIAGLALQFGRPEWLSRSLKVLVAMYKLGFDANGYPSSNPVVVEQWIDLVAHVYGLGGLAIRLEDWEAVRKLADQRTPGESHRHYGSWLRHALTMGYRASVISREKNAGLIARGHNVVRAVSTLRPDSTVDDEAILDSLCQFDALGCIVVIGERGSFDPGNFYPSFAGYYSRRTEPVLARVVDDRAIRQVIFDGDDSFLADTLVTVLRQAGESFGLGPWDGVSDPSVKRFIAAHQTLGNQNVR